MNFIQLGQIIWKSRIYNPESFRKYIVTYKGDMEPHFQGAKYPVLERSVPVTVVDTKGSIHTDIIMKYADQAPKDSEFGLQLVTGKVKPGQIGWIWLEGYPHAGSRTWLTRIEHGFVHILTNGLFDTSLKKIFLK